jgi:hypothetical protein
MDSNKASGSDDFSILFYQTFGILLKMIFLMFQDFYVDKFDLARLNRALICLFFKVKDATILKNYRPISLLNCSYKIFFLTFLPIDSILLLIG